MAIRETRLVERAIRQHWPIKNIMRAKVVTKLGDVLDDASASPREKVAACRALISASKCNVDAIRTASLVQRLDRYESDAFRETAQTLRVALEQVRAEDAAYEGAPASPSVSLNGHGA